MSVESRPQTAVDVGAYFAWWPGPRVQLRGDIGYMRLKPENSETSVTDGRAALTWFPWRKVGFGASYKYNKFRYDREILQLKLGGAYRYHGVLAEVSFAIG
jgi:hypothetical protein